MVQSFSFVLGVPVVLVLLGVCSRVSGSACDTGWVFSAAFLSLYGRDWELCGRLLVSSHSWVIGCPSGNGVWELVRNHSRSGGVALEFLSPHLIKMGAWRWRSSALHPLGFSVSVWLRLSSVLGGASPEEVFRPVPLFYMNLGFNGCIRSRVGELEAAIFSTLLRTTASSAARSSSCCRIGVSWLVAFEFSGSCRSRVFQGLRAPFSPVARGN
ncbi:hypothetical protein IGI04_000119 [Brassica rapa subsp. trilocularis]|uniref:Secreted protein n=1 Tax=Brassica rapa subsp. trilocularis TaxID=1813537 RepID=A0ABQ7NNV0_BRACM|nr:hypothetical protein IGI04_000119 [Brassica rapa subsp. trilocularis]